MKNIDFEVYLVEGEAGPLFEFECVDSDLNPIDLTDSTVDLFVRSSVGSAPVNASSTSCVITDIVNGLCTYRFEPTHLIEPGTYLGDLVITKDAKQETAPEFLRLLVRKSAR